jgi:outer membrane protein assembly factor BamB
MWRGSVENPGVAVAQPAPIMLEFGPVWTYEMEAGTSSSPAVVDGKVYIGSADYHLYCLDVNDGHQIWNATLGNRVYSSPAVANGRVYTGSDDGKFHCFNAETGEELYTVNDGDGSYVPYNTGLGQMQIRSSPIIYNNRIYVGGSSGIFYCFDADLNELWSYDTGRFIGGSAAIEDDYVYIFSTNNNLYKFDLNGNPQFSPAGQNVENSYGGGMFVMPADWAVTPVVVDDIVYVGVNTQYLVAVSAVDASPVFATKQPFDTSESSHSSLTYYNGMVYAPAGPLTVGASGTDGTNIWAAWGSWEIFCSTIVVPNTTPTDPLDALIDEPVVYIGSEAGSMTCISTTDGTALSWFTTGGNLQSTPAMYGGKLIFGSADNLVYCFQDPDFSHQVTSGISLEVNAGEANVDAGEEFVVTAKLAPGLPDMELVASVIEPDEVTTHTVTATTDIKGKAAFTYTPDLEGTWSVVVEWAGADNVRGVAYPMAYSEVLPLTALATPETLVASASADKSEMNPGDTATLTASATGGTGEYNYQWFQTVNGAGVEMAGKTSATLTVTLDEPNVYGYYCQVTDSAVNPQVHSSDTVQITVLGAGGTDMGLIYAIVGIIAVAVIAIVAYIFLKKRK